MKSLVSHLRLECTHKSNLHPLINLLSIKFIGLKNNIKINGCISALQLTQCHHLANCKYSNLFDFIYLNCIFQAYNCISSCFSCGQHVLLRDIATVSYP